jgi:hypothetical protein
VSGEAHISGSSTIFGRATVGGSARIVNGHVAGDAVVTGTAVIKSGARVYGDAYVDSGHVGIEGEVFHSRHVIHFQWGGFPDNVTVYRATGGVARVQVGCQNFPLSESFEAMEHLADVHEWELPEGWQNLIRAFRALTEGWSTDA